MRSFAWVVEQVSYKLDGHFEGSGVTLVSKNTSTTLPERR